MSVFNTPKTGSVYRDPNHFFASPAAQPLAPSKGVCSVVPRVHAHAVVTLNHSMHDAYVRLCTVKALLIPLIEDVLDCDVCYEGTVMQTLL